MIVQSQQNIIEMVTRPDGVQASGGGTLLGHQQHLQLQPVWRRWCPHGRARLHIGYEMIKDIVVDDIEYNGPIPFYMCVAAATI